VTPERWKRINDLFHSALERNAADRAEYLRVAACGDESLRKEVESLLATHASSDGFLEVPAYGVAPELMFGDPGASLAGRTIGSYRVLDEIGRGGMGVVYVAEDLRLGRRVALKALPRDYSTDPVRRERLRREARAAASLTHPSIATIYALEEIDGDLYIASELVQGHTLRDEVRAGPLAPAQLQSTLLQVAEALAAAHAQGIVHRDLKPENVMRAPDGRIKVLDFGLARSAAPGAGPTMTQLTQAGGAVGTPGYMAPEQLSGGTVDPRADVFAFGVLATEVATGEHPFGSDPAGMLRRMTELMEGRPVSAGGRWASARIEQIARRCMRASPGERYASGAELVAALTESNTAGVLDSIATQSGAAPASDALWWWQFHQAAMAIVLAAMPAVAWSIRRMIGGPNGSRIFFAALVLATISITARMNLLFTSRVHPANLGDQRSMMFPWVYGLDAALSVLMLAAALALDDQDAIAGLIIALSTVIMASVSWIEPATTRAAGIKGESRR
jgi:hypothetical protein